VRKWLDRLYDAAGVLAAISLAGIGLLMLAQSAGREFGFMLRGADDMAAWLCAASAFLGLAHTFRHGELVRVALWVGILKDKQRWWAEVFALSVTSLFVGYASWAVTSFVFESWQMNEINQGLLQIPIWIPQFTLVAGMSIFFVAVVDDFIQVLGHRQPSYERAEEKRIASGDFTGTL
jgi:TRAP-type C4-dicarboxylate transport system permease small subunit